MVRSVGVGRRRDGGEHSRSRAEEVLMTDDTGWGDFGYISGGGKALGHPTPNVDRIAAEGAAFTN